MLIILISISDIRVISQWLPWGKGGGDGMDWEFKVSKCKL